MMGELVGLGLRGIGKSTINIDLVPASVEAERAADKRRPILIAAAAVFVVGFAAYAFLSNSAATKAEAKLAELETTKADLSTSAKPIENLLKKEGAAKAAASAFIGVKDHQQFWPGVLMDLRNHFSSEFTWVTDLEPLADYDPTLPNDTKNNGKGVVKDEFAASFGKSALSEIKIEAAAVPPPKGGPKNRPAAAPTVPSANAIRIRGLWRDNDSKQDAVNKLVKALRDSNSEHFRFTIKGPDGKDVPLKDEQIVKSLTAIAEAEEEYAWPFEIVIPLSQPVPIR